MSLVHRPLPRLAGFSLIFVSIFLTIAALIFVSFLPGKEAGDVNVKTINNAKKLERVEEAMRSFMAGNGRRPCPADGQYAENTANFGREAANPGTCTVTSGMMGPDAGTGNIVAGVIPTTSLGLDDSYMYDEFGRRFTYVVDKRATLNSSCLTLEGITSIITTPTGTGGVTIKNTSAPGGTVIDNTMYAYITHGVTGYGAFPQQGSTVANRINSGSTDGDMQTNAGVDAHFPGASAFIYSTSNFTNVKVQKDWVVPTTSDTGYDDLTWYRPDLKNYCCLGPLCVAVSSPGSASIWVVDTSSNRVEGLSTSGTFQRGLGSGYNGVSGSIGVDNGGTVGGPRTVYAVNASPALFLLGGGSLGSSTSAGTGNGQFNLPQGIATDSSGNVWIADGSNDRLETISSSGTYLSQFTDSHLFCPASIAFDSGGNIWVLDCYKDWVVTYSGSGTYLSQFGSKGSGNGQLSWPYGMAIDSGGNIWVGDEGNYRVEEFSSTGTYLKQFGGKGTGNGQFNSASGGPYGITFDSGGNVWTTDTLNNRVETFSNTGTYLSQFGSSGTSTGKFSYPVGITIDSGGNIWVADTGNDRLQEFSKTGTYLNKFGSSGTGNGQFTGPIAIAIH